MQTDSPLVTSKLYRLSNALVKPAMCHSIFRYTVHLWPCRKYFQVHCPPVTMQEVYPGALSTCGPAGSISRCTVHLWPCRKYIQVHCPFVALQEVYPGALSICGHARSISRCTVHLWPCRKYIQVHCPPVAMQEVYPGGTVAMQEVYPDALSICGHAGSISRCTVHLWPCRKYIQVHCPPVAMQEVFSGALSTCGHAGSISRVHCPSVAMQEVYPGALWPCRKYIQVHCPPVAMQEVYPGALSICGHAGSIFRCTVHLWPCRTNSITALLHFELFTFFSERACSVLSLG